MAFFPQIFPRSNTLKLRLRLQVSDSACLGYCGHGAVLNATSSPRRKCLRFRGFEVKAASSSRAEGGSRRSSGGRRVYRQSQSESPLSLAPVKKFASFVVPAGMFLVVTFGINFLGLIHFLFF